MSHLDPQKNDSNGHLKKHSDPLTLTLGGPRFGDPLRLGSGLQLLQAAVEAVVIRAHGAVSLRNRKNRDVSFLLEV